MPCNLLPAAQFVLNLGRLDTDVGTCHRKEGALYFVCDTFGCVGLPYAGLTVEKEDQALTLVFDVVGRPRLYTFYFFWRLALVLVGVASCRSMNI